jgi:hypothetical protein
MTEQVPPTAVDEPYTPTTTGVPEVDRVIADVDRLDDLPLEVHLGAFERAHDALRAALDARPDVQTGVETGEHPGEPA